MATKQASSLSKPLYQGEDGNLSLHLVTVNANLAAGDVLEIADLPIGLTITGVRVITSGSIGAGSTITVKSGSTALTGALDSSAAINTDLKVAPIYLSDTAKLTITAAGAAVSGSVFVGLEYQVTGY